MGIKFYDSNGKYWGEYDETRSLFIPFKKRTMRDCYNCKRYEAEGECIECHYEPKDEPQYDFGEYADRLWKIAYERGKREALEQTEPSCDTCKLKDTTEWCKRQEVCRAYQPKDEPQTEMTTEQIVNELLSIKKILDDGKMPKQRCGNCKHLTYRWNKTWCDIKCDNPHDMVCDKWERSE